MMQITLPNIPDELERALKERASAEHKSVASLVLDALARGLGIEPQQPVKKRDLSDIAGTWGVDAETEAALEEQGRIDPELWK